MPQQTLVLRLDAGLVRRLLELVSKPNAGYRSVSELANVALLNQLELEIAEEGDAAIGIRPRPALADAGARALLASPIQEVGAQAVSAKIVSEPLGWLTNRLCPLKISVRVLANLASGGWPTVAAFQHQASAAAEALGRQLKAEDEANQRRDYSRRWIGFPVSPNDAAKSRLRFITSFGISLANGRGIGPLASLGLADVDEGRVRLTDLGWRLAASPSPLLGEDDSLATLSLKERDIFLEILRSNEGEWLALLEMVRLLERTSRLRQIIDKLAERHAEWSTGTASAYRAAVLGRLHDLGWVEIEGRGEGAFGRLTSAADAVAVAFPLSQRE